MKFVIIAALALVAVVSCAPAQPDVEIVRSTYDQQPQGSYNFDFETSDGTKRNENAEVKVVQDAENKPQEVLSVRGTYGYVDPEGNPHFITYYADETGYHAEGEGIPTNARR